MRVRFYSRVKAEAALNAPTRPLKPLMQVELEQDASQPCPLFRVEIPKLYSAWPRLVASIRVYPRAAFY